MDRLDTTTSVDTPERVRFQQRLAGPGRRAAAWMLDGTIKAILLLVVGLAVALATWSSTWMAGLGAGALSVAVFFLDWGYGAVAETLMSGRTPGKLAFGLRVVRTNGAPATFPDFVLRNLLRAVDWLPVGFGIGALVMLFDSRFRRIGDLLAGTVVVVEERGRVLAQVVVDPPVTSVERQALPPAVRLTRDELLVIEAFLRRRRNLSAERAEELAALLGPALSKRTGVEGPTWERVLTLAYARATGKDR
jgi:uncharacterized RDD family membrane protein YckC